MLNRWWHDFDSSMIITVLTSLVSTVIIMLLSKSCHHLFIIFLPTFYHHLFTIDSSSIFHPFIQLLARRRAEFSGAGDWHQRAQWSDNALLSLAEDELGSINHSIIIARGLTDSWSRTLENWTSILSHLHRLVEAVDGLIGATVLKHIS
jgi:hypothetical protein